MTARWQPVEGGIVPTNDPSGPAQGEERFAALLRALEDARSEYRLRRYEAAEDLLRRVIVVGETATDHRFRLLAAAAYSLQGRIHWRRAERESENQAAGSESQERGRQNEAFGKAIELFARHQLFIPPELPESRLLTDYAVALFRVGNTEAAISMLQRAQATGLMTADAFGYLGIAHHQRGELVEAERALNKGLQLAPGDKVLLETLAAVDASAGNDDKALRTYCRAAVVAGNEDDLASAQRLLRAALKIRSDDAQALSMMTLLLRSINEDGAAKQLLDATLQTHPANPWALGLRAMILRDRGETDAALRDFSQISVNTADLAWVLIEHARATWSSDTSAAQKLLNQASELLGKDDPRIAQAEIQLQVQIAISSVAGFGSKIIGWLRDKAERIGESPAVRTVIEKIGTNVVFDQLMELAKREPAPMGALEEIISRWPDRVEPREALARLQLENGKYAEAIAVLDAALDIDPVAAGLLGLKAEALDALGQLADAVRFYRRACRAAPGDDRLFDAFIAALVRADRLEEALIEVENRLVVSPENGFALTEKGRLLRSCGRFAEAAAALQDAEQRVADEARFSVRLELAQTWRDLDRYDEAIGAFGRAAQSDNQLCDAHAHEAVALIEIAEYGRAAEILKQAIERIATDPSNGDVKRRLGWLWNARGWALRLAGGTEVSELKPMFETAIAFGSLFARKNLGWALMQEHEHFARGERLISELIEQRAANNAPDELVGWCYFMLKQYEVAEHWLRGVINRDSDDIETRFDLALVMLVLKPADARTEYANVSKRAREKSAQRQRGLFHIATADLIDACREKRVDWALAKPIYDELWEAIQSLGLSGDLMSQLSFPAKRENAA